MKEAPDSKIYEDSLTYMPYKTSWQKVLDTISTKTPQGASLLDIMCGPGHLLGKVKEIRNDITLYGIDIDPRYIEYSKKAYPDIDFSEGDIRSLEIKESFDVVVCTGSVHHLPYEEQEGAIQKISQLTKSGGFAIISDCHIEDYTNEEERMLAAAKVGYEYIKATIQNGAPKDVVEFTLDILNNDVMMNEFKTSLKKRLPTPEKYFDNVEVIKTWPESDSEYGDYVMICRK